MKVAIIEDDLLLKKYMTEYLQADRFDVVLIDETKDVIAQLELHQPSIILLDINLPQFDGFYYTKMIRKRWQTPIIILSARSDESEQIRGMTFGADDYITKPFSVGVLVAKIHAVLRRFQPSTEELEINNLLLHEKTMRLSREEQQIELSKNEFRILHIFMARPDEVITREELLTELWDHQDFVDDNTLSVNMTRIKQKLKMLGIEQAFVTKRGVGYVFTPNW